MSDLVAMVSTCRLTTLVLDFTGRGKLAVADAAKFGGVLAQCQTLEHLELMIIKFDRNTVYLMLIFGFQFRHTKFDLQFQYLVLAMAVITMLIAIFMVPCICYVTDGLKKKHGDDLERYLTP